MSLWKSKEGQAREVKPREGSASQGPLPPASSPATSDRDTGEGAQMANIGKSISIKGDVTGDEDTVIEGRVEGHIELKNHHLTVGPNGDVKGEISAKQVTIVGRVQGNVNATERIEVSDSGRLDGDLNSPRLLVQEGAQLNGSVSMKAPSGVQQQPPQKKAEETTPRIGPPQQQQKAG
jgi:cytoskeletal protein CcmA (bactofilin family)